MMKKEVERKHSHMFIGHSNFLFQLLGICGGESVQTKKKKKQKQKQKKRGGICVGTCNAIS
jgi:hypothetical protein